MPDDDDDVTIMLAMLCSQDENMAADLDGKFGRPPSRKWALAAATINNGSTLLHYVAGATWMPPVFLSPDIWRAERVLTAVERALADTHLVGAAAVTDQIERRAALFAVWLLQHGANAAARTTCGGTTPLHVAAARGWALMAGVLTAFVLDAADLVNASDGNGNTAMHMAANGGYGNLFLLMAEQWHGRWDQRNATGQAAAMLLVKRLLSP